MEGGTSYCIEQRLVSDIRAERCTHRASSTNFFSELDSQALRRISTRLSAYPCQPIPSLPPGPPRRRPLTLHRWRSAGRMHPAYVQYCGCNERSSGKSQTRSVATQRAWPRARRLPSRFPSFVVASRLSSAQGVGNLAIAHLPCATPTPAWHAGCRQASRQPRAGSTCCERHCVF